MSKFNVGDKVLLNGKELPLTISAVYPTQSGKTFYWVGECYGTYSDDDLTPFTTKSASEKLIEMGYKLSDNSQDMEEWKNKCKKVIKVFYRSQDVIKFKRVGDSHNPETLTKDELEVCLQRLKEVDTKDEPPIAG